MATPVLPYPNMDFTPLDILTAAEMDQMVANDQYLRDFCAGLADGTNLSDGVIQARKLDSGIGDYSTSEVDTGFTWIDGKHIYKKTINFGALPNNDTKRVDHGVTNIDRIIQVEQSINNAPSGSLHGFLFIASGQATVNDFNFWGTDTQICIRTNGDRRESYAYITLYYTKTN